MHRLKGIVNNVSGNEKEIVAKVTFRQPVDVKRNKEGMTFQQITFPTSANNNFQVAFAHFEFDVKNPNEQVQGDTAVRVGQMSFYGEAKSSAGRKRGSAPADPSSSPSRSLSSSKRSHWDHLHGHTSRSIESRTRDDDSMEDVSMEDDIVKENN